MASPRLEIWTQDGSIIEDQTVSDVQQLIEQGVVGPEDQARRSGGGGDWHPITTMQGLDWTRLGVHQNSPFRSKGFLIAVLAPVVVLVAGALLAAMVQLRSEDHTISEWHDRHHRAIPLIALMNKGGTLESTGTGFVFEDDDKWLLATNRHVISGSPTFDQVEVIFFSVNDAGEIIDSGSDEYFTFKRPTSEFRVHKEHIDLAILDVTESRRDLEAAGVVPLTVAEPDKIDAGERLVWFGHPGVGSRGGNTRSLLDIMQQARDLHRITQGDANNTKRDELVFAGMTATSPWRPFEADFIITTGTIVGGNSGGPMIRSDDGLVVGVVCAGSSQGGAERNIGIRARHIRETIDSGIQFDPRTMSNP